MRSFKVLIVALLAVSYTNVGRSAEGAAAKPNVLFLICDDLNCDLGCYGHPLVKTPNIDRIAARGLRFANVQCQYPLCCPSRASFMSGLYPDQTLIHTNAIFIREHTPNVETLSQMFRMNNYFVTRIGKIYHYGVPTNIGTAGHDDPLSWDYTINPRGRDKDEEDQVFSLVPGNYGGTLSWMAADGTDEEQTDGIGANAAVEQLQKYAKQKKQFFLAVGLYRPHTPYVSPKKYFEMYPTEKMQVPKIPDGYLATLPEPAQRSIHRKKDQIDLPDKLARQAMQGYYAAISFADAQVGRITNALDETGLGKNTIVVFTSDHGYHMGEHGHWQKITLFENATHVPLIIAVPGMKTAGQTTQSLAEMVDYYPTLAELCGVTPPDYLSGVSLVPVLNDPAAHPRDSALTQFENGYSLRTPQFRYTEWGKDGAEGNELYDHESDPAEMVNLAKRPEQKDTIAGLSKLLHERIADAQRAPKGVVQRDYIRIRSIGP